MKTQQVLEATFLDILFEGKNKAYGAYLLRKGYNKRLSLALALSLGITLLVNAIVFFWPTKQKPGQFRITETIITNGTPVKPKDPIKKPINDGSKKIVKTIKYSVPVIVKNFTPTEPLIKTDLIDGQISNVTSLNNGIEDGTPPQPYNPEGNGKIVPNPIDNYVPPIETKKPKEILKLGFATAKPSNWDNYLKSALQPIVNNAQENGCEPGRYKFVIGFIIDENGNPIEAEIIEGSDYFNLGTYAKNILLKGPKWPVNRNDDGEPTKSSQQTSFTFEINE